jgi:uncharacterized membrane protein YjjP (DUF1212 family)
MTKFIVASVAGGVAGMLVGIAVAQATGARGPTVALASSITSLVGGALIFKAIQ